MGKKTNWTLSEDQALCRAWLCASDATLGHHHHHATSGNGSGSGDPKAGTFWGLVHQLFHAELETSVDRPVTGLKIRWTRINRDVQRFALALARVHVSQSTVATTASGDAAGADSELERERQAIDEAIDVVFKEQGNKFAFESCWRLLRFSPRWMQLLANSAGVSASTFQSATANATSAAALLAGEDNTANGSAAAATASTIALHKRRLSEMIETHGRASFPESATVYLAAMAQELARQSDLLEEQNAIALFRMELELIEDDTAREYFTSLRHTYVKRMRRDDDAPASETGAGSSDHATSAGKETADL